MKPDLSVCLKCRSGVNILAPHGRVVLCFSGGLLRFAQHLPTDKTQIDEAVVPEDCQMMLEQIVSNETTT